jgi:hypothetical protein
MITGIEKIREERKLIKQETRITIIISLALLVSVGIYALLAYFIKIRPPLMDNELLEKVYGIVNLIVIMMMVIILGIRRSIYYSPRFIREDFTLTQVLQRWRIIDIILLAVAETIPICGMVISFLGMPFNRTFHFFLASALVMIIIMPGGLKVRSKLGILRKTHPDL